MLAFVNGALLGGYVYSKSSLGLEGKRQIMRLHLNINATLMSGVVFGIPPEALLTRASE